MYQTYLTKFLHFGRQNNISSPSRNILNERRKESFSLPQNTNCVNYEYCKKISYCIPGTFIISKCSCTAINLLFDLLIFYVLRSLFWVEEKINLLVACCQVDLFCYLNQKSYLNSAACFYSQVRGHSCVPFESHRRSSWRLEEGLWSMSTTPVVSGCGWLQQLWKLQTKAWELSLAPGKTCLQLSRGASGQYGTRVRWASLARGFIMEEVSTLCVIWSLLQKKVCLDLNKQQKIYLQHPTYAFPLTIIRHYRVTFPRD